MTTGLSVKLVEGAWEVWRRCHRKIVYCYVNVSSYKLEWRFYRRLRETNILGRTGIHVGIEGGQGRIVGNNSKTSMNIKRTTEYWQHGNVCTVGSVLLEGSLRVDLLRMSRKNKLSLGRRWSFGKFMKNPLNLWRRGCVCSMIMYRMTLLNKIT